MFCLLAKKYYQFGRKFHLFEKKFYPLGKRRRGKKKEKEDKEKEQREKESEEKKQPRVSMTVRQWALDILIDRKFLCYENHKKNARERRSKYGNIHC